MPLVAESSRRSLDPNGRERLRTYRLTDLTTAGFHGDGETGSFSGARIPNSLNQTSSFFNYHHGRVQLADNPDGECDALDTLAVTTFCKVHYARVVLKQTGNRNGRAGRLHAGVL